jgi:hypothetical protein
MSKIFIGKKIKGYFGMHYTNNVVGAENHLFSGNSLGGKSPGVLNYFYPGCPTGRLKVICQRRSVFSVTEGIQIDEEERLVKLAETIRAEG